MRRCVTACFKNVCLLQLVFEARTLLICSFRNSRGSCLIRADPFKSCAFDWPGIQSWCVLIAGNRNSWVVVVAHWVGIIPRRRYALSLHATRAETGSTVSRAHHISIQNVSFTCVSEYSNFMFVHILVQLAIFRGHIFEVIALQQIQARRFPDTQIQRRRIPDQNGSRISMPRNSETERSRGPYLQPSGNPETYTGRLPEFEFAHELYLPWFQFFPKQLLANMRS